MTKRAGRILLGMISPTFVFTDSVRAEDLLARAVLQAALFSGKIMNDCSAEIGKLRFFELRQSNSPPEFDGASMNKRVAGPVSNLQPMEVEGFDSLCELALDMRWS